jgi:glutamate--cysteine ligase
MLVANRVSPAHVRARVAGLFQPPTPATAGPGLVGVEVELIGVKPTGSIPRPASRAEVEAALEVDPGLAGAARLTFEPGGQVELSPSPAPGLTGLLSQVARLVTRLRSCGSGAGIEFVTPGTNPWHGVDDVPLQTPQPRYHAQEARYRSVGPAGIRMMRLTAALQVGVDLGPPAVAAERWWLLNAAGPALTAAFAHSPVLEGRITGAPSTRSQIWQDTDATRTGFDGIQVGVAGGGPDPDAYLDFVLGAVAIPLPRAGEDDPAGGRSFGAWMESAATLERPDADDLEHHLTTLFPPVRPRGHFEVRYLDAVPYRWLPVAVATLAALAYDPVARRDAMQRLDGSGLGLEAWRRAARRGMADPDLRAQAVDLLEIAVAGMGRLPAGYAPGGVGDLAREFIDMYPRSARSPGDDARARFAARPEDIETWK